MSAAFKVDTDVFRRLGEKFNNPALTKQLTGIAAEPGVAAIIAQAVGDNFSQHGPGWPPLKTREGEPLRKTNTLYKSVTTPGAPGNIYKVDGSVVRWGTNLIYADIHNKGGVITAKKAKMLFIPLTKKAEQIGPIPKERRAERYTPSGKPRLIVGKDMIFARSVRIPARPFLVLRDVWKTRLFEYMMKRATSFITREITR